MVLGPGLAIFPRGRAAPEIAGRYKPLAHCFHTVCLSGGLRSIAVTLNEEFGINAELRNGVLIAWVPSGICRFQHRAHGQVLAVPRIFRNKVSKRTSGSSRLSMASAQNSAFSISRPSVC
jgi:hypothetical protein